MLFFSASTLWLESILTLTTVNSVFRVYEYFQAQLYLVFGCISEPNTAENRKGTVFGYLCLSSHSRPLRPFLYFGTIVIIHNSSVLIKCWLRPQNVSYQGRLRPLSKSITFLTLTSEEKSQDLNTKHRYLVHSLHYFQNTCSTFLPTQKNT